MASTQTIPRGPFVPAGHRAPGGAWAPVVRALRDGGPGSVVVVTDRAEADAIVVALRRACTRSPWLRALATAHVDRLLRAAGIMLIGPARARFDEYRGAEQWGERVDEFERAACAVPRDPRVTSLRPASAPAGLVASGLNYATRPGSSPWSAGSAVGRLDALTATPLATTAPCAPVDVTDRGLVLEAWIFVFLRCELTVGARVAEPTGGEAKPGATREHVHDRDTGDLLVHVSASSRPTRRDDWCTTDNFDARVTGRGVVLDHAPDAGRIALVEGLVAAYRSGPA